MTIRDRLTGGRPTARRAGSSVKRGGKAQSLSSDPRGLLEDGDGYHGRGGGTRPLELQEKERRACLLRRPQTGGCGTGRSQDA